MGDPPFQILGLTLRTWGLIVLLVTPVVQVLLAVSYLFMDRLKTREDLAEDARRTNQRFFRGALVMVVVVVCLLFESRLMALAALAYSGFLLGNYWFSNWVARKLYTRLVI